MTLELSAVQRPLVITAYTATSCLGRGLKPLAAALRAGRGALAPCHFDTVDLDLWVGEVEGLDEPCIPASLRSFDCRNNRLARRALAEDGFEQAVRSAIARVGPARVALALGTSTSGMLETERAYRQRAAGTGALPEDFRYAGSHNPFSVSAFVRELLGIEGPSLVISTACSSSAKVFASAQRMIEAGIVDAALVGGIDSLCLTTLYGFHSLQLTARGPCRPFAADRDGISIGEGAAFALLERAEARSSSGDMTLLGVGESSDAYHLSTPHPQGLGARLAMERALAHAALEPADIDYLNLHGTATPSNDRAEGHAVHELFGSALPCSSTKGATGHTLGAAGALEAIIGALALAEGFMPAGINIREPDATLGVNYLTHTDAARPARVMSNSFGFGGSNCSLILGRLE
jgi:3-oxoacyl-[acyl-carrier-protein] synthase-1